MYEGRIAADVNGINRIVVQDLPRVCESRDTKGIGQLLHFGFSPGDDTSNLYVGHFRIGVGVDFTSPPGPRNTDTYFNRLLPFFFRNA